MNEKEGNEREKGFHHPTSLPGSSTVLIGSLWIIDDTKVKDREKSDK